MLWVELEPEEISVLHKGLQAVEVPRLGFLELKITETWSMGILHPCIQPQALTITRLINVRSSNLVMDLAQAVVFLVEVEALEEDLTQYRTQSLWLIFHRVVAGKSSSRNFARLEKFSMLK
jgi:hypothetical protein